MHGNMFWELKAGTRSDPMIGSGHAQSRMGFSQALVAPGALLPTMPPISPNDARIQPYSHVMIRLPSGVLKIHRVAPDT